MRQFVLPSGWRNGPCVVTGERARYLRDVLRLNSGDAFPGLDAEGRRYQCTVTTLSKDRVELAVIAEVADQGAAGAMLRDVRSGYERNETPIVPALSGAPAGEFAQPRITLAQALPRGTKMDQIVRQTTEAGVNCIVPIITERSIGADGAGPAKLDRWNRVAREAVQQSGSDQPTVVVAPVRLADLAEAIEPDSLRLFLHETPLASNALHRYLTYPPSAITLCVGPEGGFSATETRLLGSYGFLPLYLGPNVLRTETAAIFAIGAMRIVMLERASWIPSA